MRVSMLVRPTLLMMALVALGACSDSPAGPAASRSMRPLSFDPPATWRSDGAPVTVRVVDSDEVEFTLDPLHAQNVSLGDHTISFPAYSICDPATSSYGPGSWDSWCQRLYRPITIHAKWSLDNGHARVDFEPALRFVPSSDNDRWVVLSFKEPKSLQSDKDYEILWKGPTGAWVDESRYDSTLRAWYDWYNNRVSRRIKHFSGYNVTAGFIDIGVDVGGVDVMRSF